MSNLKERRGPSKTLAVGGISHKKASKNKINESLYEIKTIFSEFSYIGKCHVKLWGKSLQHLYYGLQHKKTCLRGFRRSEIQTSLLRYRN